MNELKHEGIFIFTDGSVNTATQVGYGACLIITDLDLPISELAQQIQVRKFEATSSTKLELQLILWAFGQLDSFDRKCTFFTDSQNSVGLPQRRTKLEQAQYRNKRNTVIHHHELYKAFYQMMDACECSFVKVKGHQPKKQKSPIEQIFTLVDRAARSAMRNQL